MNTEDTVAKSDNVAVTEELNAALGKVKEEVEEEVVVYEDKETETLVLTMDENNLVSEVNVESEDLEFIDGGMVESLEEAVNDYNEEIQELKTRIEGVHIQDKAVKEFLLEILTYL